MSRRTFHHRLKSPPCEFIQRISGRYSWCMNLVLVVKVVSVVIEHDI